MKLVIFLTTGARRRMVESNHPLEVNLSDFNSWQPDDLEDYGRTWAKFWKTDIVMLIEEVKETDGAISPPERSP